MDRLGAFLACLALAVAGFAVDGAGPAAGKGPCKPANDCDRPSISHFSASPASAASGATVTVSASVSAATSCTLSSNKPVAGLPATFPCEEEGLSREVVMPENQGKTALVYKLTLAVSGPGGTRKAKTSLSVATLPRVTSFGVSGITSEEATISGEIATNGFQTGWAIWIVRQCKHSECVFEHPIAEGTLAAAFEPAHFDGTATEMEPASAFYYYFRLRYGSTEQEQRGGSFHTKR